MNLFILKTFIPEIFLSFCILIQLIYNATLINYFKNNFPIISKEIFIQTFYILSCVLLLLLNLKYETYFYNFIFINDLGSISLKILLIITSLILLLIIIQNFELQNLNFFEYFILYLLAVLSLLLLINVSDLISTYLIIEMQALCFYVLASFNRDSAFSTEAGLKYFISGAFISVIFLGGCSIIYSLLGTLNFNHISLLLYLGCYKTTTYFYLLLLLGNFFITVTILFKLAIVPFHFWAPDAYEGAPLVSTIILSVLPKISLISLLIKWLLLFSCGFNEIFFLIEILGCLSIFVGIGFAIQQKRLKRLMIYSSISQIGFLIVALSKINFNTLISVYIFLIVYLISSILFWLYLTSFYNFQKKIRTFYNSVVSTLYLASMSNFFKINVIWSFSILVLFFSIAGLPPFCGFFAKIFIIFNIIEFNNLILALVVIGSSLISAFYYIRFLKVIFFEPLQFSLKNNSAQIIFLNYYFYYSCFINTSLLFLLIYFFFNPIILFLWSSRIVFSSFLF